MHARVTTVQAQPGKIEEAIGIARDSAVPAAKEQPGFKGLTLLSDFDTGKSIVITFWDSEADMQASETSGYYQEQLGKIASVIAGPPVRESYEVTIQE